MKFKTKIFGTITVEEKMCDCGERAIWLYAPGYEDKERNDFYCDDCVPRGCSCNREIIDYDGDWDDPNNYYTPTDEQGREYPCCEFFEIGEDE